jgi:hypothetical protein
VTSPLIISDLYLCPGGNQLTTSGALVNDGATLPYRASKIDCDACTLKPQCCPKKPVRKLPRSIHEGARDMARIPSAENEWLVSRCERKKVEMLFAHLKRIFRLDRLRLHGPQGARDEFHRAAAAQNLRKLAKIIAMPLLSADHLSGTSVSLGWPLRNQGGCNRHLRLADRMTRSG